MSQIYSLNDFIPQLPKDNQYWVADTARIVGNVIINELVSIWFGAVVRGDNERIFLGSGSNIQENCVLHTDIGYPLTVYSNCTIGHGAILHGCTVKESSLIGMGSVILNGAEVGKNARIEGSIVGERAKIGESSEVLELTIINHEEIQMVDPVRSNVHI